MQAGPPTDYANEFDEIEDDVLGEDSNDEDDMYSYRKKKKKGKNKKQDADQEPAFMFFDFRKGPTLWPDGVELVDAQKASELLEKVPPGASTDKAQFTLACCVILAPLQTLWSFFYTPLHASFSAPAKFGDVLRITCTMDTAGKKSFVALYVTKLSSSFSFPPSSSSTSGEGGCCG